MKTYELGEAKVKALGLPPFVPLSWIRSGMSQTMASAFWPVPRDPKPTAIHTLALGDGDELVLVEDRPQSWKPGDRIVVMVHGLVSHYQSNYMKRVARRLFRHNLLIVRVNLRGCGIGFGHAKKPYHSGRSEDLRQVLKWAAIQYPGSPVTQVGFSLGGNLTLKMAGEDGSNPTGGLDSVIAISPPVDLAATAVHLKASNHLLFDQFFVWKLRYDIWKHHSRYPDLPKVKLPLKMALTDLDDFYTAPVCGFKSAQDYYAQASSSPWVSSIRVRGLILCSQDDPIIDAQSYSKMDVPPNVDLIMTSHGGHVGFISEPVGRFDVQWMDRLIARWIH